MIITKKEKDTLLDALLMMRWTVHSTKSTLQFIDERRDSSFALQALIENAEVKDEIR